MGNRQRVTSAEEIGRAIQTRRAREDVSLRKVAEELGISKQTLVDVEQGRGDSVRLATVMKILGRFGVSIFLSKPHLGVVERRPGKRSKWQPGISAVDASSLPPSQRPGPVTTTRFPKRK